MVPFLLALSLSAAQEATPGGFSRAAKKEIDTHIRTALSAAEVKGVVQGAVTYVGDDFFFIQSGDDGLKVVTEFHPRPEKPKTRPIPPKVGDVLAVSGSPSLEGGRVVMLSRDWRKVGEGVFPAVRKVGPSDLVYAGADNGEGDANGLRVEIEGRAIGLTESGFAVELDNLPINVITHDLPGFLRDCERTHPLVKVRGVAEMMLDQSSLFHRDRYVLGVKIDVSSPEDIELNPDLLYYANCRDKRVMYIGAAIVVVLVAIIVFFGAVAFRQRRGLFRSRTIMAERKRMADDLHDTIEQHLVGAGMFLKLQRIKEAEEILVRAKREIRDIVWGLKNDDMMRLSPAEMLRRFAHEETTKGLYRVEARLEGLPEHLEAAAMRDLSLIVREAIGNAVRHGGAKKIAMASDPAGDGWVLRIANDGEPFDEASAPGPGEGHFGIEGMRQRARRIGATVSFSVKGEWTVLELRCEHKGKEGK